MKPFAIPVVALGPGSQAESESLNYLVMPSGMHTYKPPILPEPEDIDASGAAQAVLANVIDALDSGTGPNAGGRFDIAGLPAADLKLIDQVLGEGEVSATVTGAHGRILIQESVFAGVWRVRQFDRDGALLADHVEVGDVPNVIRAAARSGSAVPLSLPAMTEGVINAPALLAEIVEQRQVAGQGGTHILNLSLLPFSPDDAAWLDAALGRGEVSLLSRGYGNCRITATGLAGVWWVQFFNSQDALILNTIEVTEVPSVARAAAEDFEDSRGRLVEVLEWLN